MLTNTSSLIQVWYDKDHYRRSGTVQDTVRWMAESIWTDIQTDPILRACKSFSELHDHCDANMLGFQAEYCTNLGIEQSVDVLNAATDMVDGWLKNGYPGFNAGPGSATVDARPHHTAGTATPES